MNEVLKEDSLNIDHLLESIKTQAIDYLKNISTRPTSTRSSFEIKSKLSIQGLGAEAALNEFNTRLEPLMVGSSGPRFWGLVVGGSTPASIMGDWLTTIYDQISFSTSGHGDISSLIELETIQLLLDLFNLPKDFLGGFVTGATMSNFTSLAVARQWIGKESDKDYAKNGVPEKINILSGVPHSSIFKALSLLGIGSNTITLIKTKEENRESINIVALEKEIQNLNGKPFILISNAGTVNTVDFDNLSLISKLKEKYKFWWHIDAAFGGFVACSEKYKHLVQGWENADSITVDCHKWLNVPYESAVFFVKEKHKILQTETFQNSNAPYLSNPLEDFNYMNFLPENSRRLKALPAWFTLKAYGKEGYKNIIENNINMAQKLGDYIKGNYKLELIAPVRLNVVCFTHSNNEINSALLNKINNSKKVFVSPTVYKGINGIRVAFVNWRTSEEDVDILIEILNDLAYS